MKFLENFDNVDKCKFLSWIICGLLSLIGLAITKNMDSFNVMWMPLLYSIFG